METMSIYNINGLLETMSIYNINGNPLPLSLVVCLTPQIALQVIPDVVVMVTNPRVVGLFGNTQQPIELVGKINCSPGHLLPKSEGFPKLKF